MSDQGVTEFKMVPERPTSEMIEADHAVPVGMYGQGLCAASGSTAPCCKPPPRTASAASEEIAQEIKLSRGHCGVELSKDDIDRITSAPSSR